MENQPKNDTKSPDVVLTDPQGKSQVIDLAKVSPAHDPNCEHRYEVDKTDETPNFVAYMCRCGRGYLQRKS